MKISKIPGLGSKGIYVDDVDLMNIHDDEWMEIGRLHMQNLVTVVRNTSLTKERFGDLITKFGGIRVTAFLSRKYKKKYGKDWLWVMDQVKANSPLIDEEDRRAILAAENASERTSNGYALGRVCGGYTGDLPNGFFADGELLWHSNESGTLTATPGVALMGSKGMVGSATGFITTCDYYESVSESFRSELDEMIIIHRFTPGKINPGLREDQDFLMHYNMCPIDNTEIPMVIQSPGGVRGLHFSINTAYSIKGLTVEESHRIFAQIEKDLFVNKYIYDHWYQQDNDLLLFDNSITQHRRSGSNEGRLAFRLAHDYTNLQNGPYQPYYQDEFKKKYNKEIREVIKGLGIKNFKFPNRTFREMIGL